METLIASLIIACSNMHTDTKLKQVCIERVSNCYVKYVGDIAFPTGSKVLKECSKEVLK